MSDYVSEEWEKAEQALEDAEVLRRHGGSDNAVASRLYYACFHAAKAILYENDETQRVTPGWCPSLVSTL